MKRRTGLLLGGAMLALGTAALAGWWWHRATSEVEALTAAPDGADLTASEIAAGLGSDDFRVRLQARRQIDRLPEARRAAVLQELARDARAEVRLLAVSGLEGVKGVPGVVEALRRLAQADPDPDVRSAAERLSGGSP